MSPVDFRQRSSQRGHRVSQRSHGTSSSSSNGSKEKCKNCCRKFVSLMCTQVGVGGLLISYAVVGAFAFIAIEGEMGKGSANMTVEIHNRTTERLWFYTLKHNINNETYWRRDIEKILVNFQNEIVVAVKDGYNELEPLEIWTFPASLMYCLSVFTMIGYGQLTPRTVPGKISTIMYAVFGIPLYILYFMNMGKIFANLFKYLYRAMYRCLHREKKIQEEEARLAGWEEPTILVPSTACIWVMIFYMTFGTVMFAEWEKWSYLNSCYFSFTSLAKIGIGDIVPGVGINGHTDDNALKLIINFMYLLVGMALIAMCFTLMKEEFLLKINTLNEEFKEKMYYCGLKLGIIESDGEDEGDSYEESYRKPYRKSVRRK